MLEKRLKLVEVMDREGFYGFHMAEHHSTPLGWVPSPSVFVSAAIQRTKRLRIGPLVYVLPMYHPLRVYEEVCMLDHMSKGRLMFGVGRGAAMVEHQRYGIDPAQAPAMYHEAFAVIMKACEVRRAEFRRQVLQFQGLPRSIEAGAAPASADLVWRAEMPTRSAGPRPIPSTWFRLDLPRAPAPSPIATARNGPSSAARLPKFR